MERKVAHIIDNLTIDCRGKDDLKILRLAIEKRLRMNTEHVFTGKWTEAMGLMALPTNAPSSLKLLAYLVDDMWHYAGDTSPDVRLFYNRLYERF
jgi:ubiquinone biosynthesis protein COQ9